MLYYEKFCHEKERKMSISIGHTDDRDIVKLTEVEEIVRILCVSYSHIRRSFIQNENEINTLLKDGDVNKVIGILIRVYGLPKGFIKRIGYSAKIDAAAALQLKVEIFTGKPLGGTVYFKYSQSDLCKISPYLVLHMMAHELAHARMAIDCHKLQYSEFATDILALLATGNSKGYDKHMTSPFVQYGYIRTDLLDELYRHLARYLEIIYLK